MNGSILRGALLVAAAVVAIVFYAMTFVVQQTQSAIVLENLISQFLFNKAAEGVPPADSSK